MPQCQLEYLWWMQLKPSKKVHSHSASWAICWTSMLLGCRWSVMEVVNIMIIHYLFVPVNPVVCCYRKVPSLIGHNSTCKAFSPPFITIIVSTITIIHECKLRRCVIVYVCVCVCLWVGAYVLVLISVCVPACAHVQTYSTYIWITDWSALCDITDRAL